MTRVLKRPMFRLGGNTDQGIMSGVVPRQGFSTGLSDELRQKKIRDVLSGDTTLGEAQDLSRALAYRPRGVTPADALIEFGLNVASAEPRGSIFATAADAAKEPFQRYAKSKAESEAARYVSEADMFKTLVESGAEATGEGGKGWLEQWKFAQIPILNKQIDTLAQKKKNNTITPAEELELQSLREQKGRLVKLDPLTESWAKSENAAYAIQQEALNLLTEDRKKPENERKYPPDATEGSIEVVMDAIRIVKQKLQTGLNEGGRVGYQQGMSVMPTAMPAQEDTMPEELSGISYEELRARLPQEVSDEIVRLLANSPEALEDFAVIQTEQDIANFNKKYGVNLVLPAEG